MELKKCPFCKKNAVFVGVHDNEGNYHGNLGCDYEQNPWSGLSYALHHEGWDDCILCTDDTEQTMGGILFDTAEEAIEEWNNGLTFINKSTNDTKRYNIYYRKYNIIANAYIPYVEVVNTSDIYHEIGKMICSSMEKIESIRYTESKLSQEDCEKLWAELGYRKLTNNIWICDKAKED